MLILQCWTSGKVANQMWFIYFEILDLIVLIWYCWFFSVLFFRGGKLEWNCKYIQNTDVYSTYSILIYIWMHTNLKWLTGKTPQLQKLNRNFIGIQSFVCVHFFSVEITRNVNFVWMNKSGRKRKRNGWRLQRIAKNTLHSCVILKNWHAFAYRSRIKFADISSRHFVKTIHYHLRVSFILNTIHFIEFNSILHFNHYICTLT